MESEIEDIKKDISMLKSFVFVLATIDVVAAIIIGARYF